MATPVVDFATFRDQITNREMKGMFRTGWQMDYPTIENFLGPIYATGAGSNDGDYSNPDFDAKLQEAAAAPDAEEANTLYQEAEAMLAEDLPAIPLWYTQHGRRLLHQRRQREDQPVRNHGSAEHHGSSVEATTHSACQSALDRQAECRVAAET